jgi:hypothetical protein
MAEVTENQAREIEAMLERLAAECRRIEGLWWRHRLEVAQIRPGQRGDGALVEEFSRYTKSSEASMDTIFAEITDVERVGRTLRVSGRGRVAGAIAERLRKALRTVVGLPLGQMHSRDQAQAGQIEAATIEPDGTVRISASIEDGPAMRKLHARVYPGISIRFDGDEIDEVALVDRDFSKLSKGAGAADTVLVKIYSGGIGKMSKSDEEAKKVLAAEAAEKARVQEIIDALGKGPPAVQERALWAAQIELCKARRLPRIMPGWAGGR